MFYMGTVSLMQVSCNGNAALIATAFMTLAKSATRAQVYFSAVSVKEVLLMLESTRVSQ
jgi:hypothetical protein